MSKNNLSICALALITLTRIRTIIVWYCFLVKWQVRGRASYSRNNRRVRSFSQQLACAWVDCMYTCVLKNTVKRIKDTVYRCAVSVIVECFVSLCLSVCPSGGRFRWVLFVCFEVSSFCCYGHMITHLGVVWADD